MTLLKLVSENENRKITSKPNVYFWKNDDTAITLCLRGTNWMCLGFIVFGSFDCLFVCLFVYLFIFIFCFYIHHRYRIFLAFGLTENCIEKYSLHYAGNRFAWSTLILETPHSFGIRIKWVDRIFDFMCIQICVMGLFRVVFVLKNTYTFINV